MILFAHSGMGYGWGGPVEPWEFHPILIHFPIAFLLGGVILDLYAWRHGRLALGQVATGLLITGVLFGVLAALAGVIAIYTIPGTHTEEAHHLMPWHIWGQAFALVLFGCVAWLRWRAWSSSLGLVARVIGWIAAVVLTVGAGIEHDLMKPGLHEGHHGGGPAKAEQASSYS